MTVESGATVSLVATVLNEYGGLPAWLEALERQTRLPDECLIVDGGSSDGTWELLQGWQPDFPVVLRRAPGTTISEGRNLALNVARGDIIAVTDAGTSADQRWLERLTGPLAEHECIDVAAGFFAPRDDGVWSRTLGAATLPDLDEVDPERFQPSSRSVAFRREWIELGFQYPEWLDYCEDLVFDLKLRRAGARFALVSDATVCFDVRESWPAFFRQYFRYARGDGKAGLFPRRHLLRYAAYVLGSTILVRRRLREVVALAALGALYTARPARRLWNRHARAGMSTGSTLVALPLLPLHMVVGDVAKMTGYPVGLAWRARRWGLNSFGRVGWWSVRRDGARWRL